MIWSNVGQKHLVMIQMTKIQIQIFSAQTKGFVCCLRTFFSPDPEENLSEWSERNEHDPKTISETKTKSCELGIVKGLSQQLFQCKTPGFRVFWTRLCNTRISCCFKERSIDAWELHQFKLFPLLSQNLHFIHPIFHIPPLCNNIDASLAETVRIWWTIF